MKQYNATDISNRSSHLYLVFTMRHSMKLLHRSRTSRKKLRYRDERGRDKKKKGEKEKKRIKRLELVLERLERRFGVASSSSSS